MSAEPFRPSDLAPDCVKQYGVVLAGLGAAIARLFLRRPRLALLTIPLWMWLNRSVRRLERAMARPVAAARARAAGGTRAASTRERVRLPGRAGWLVREFGWEVASYGSQLRHVLIQPEMQAALAARPAMGRILRPICRMLGVTGVAGVHPVKLPTPAMPPAPARAASPKPPRPPRPQAWVPGRAALASPGVGVGWSRKKSE